MSSKKENETFDHIDEWVLQYGQKFSKEKAAKFSLFQWKVAKKEILKVKSKMEDFKDSNILYQLALKDYKGILWKYQEVIKKFKIKS